MSGAVSIKSLIQSCAYVSEWLLCIHLGASQTAKAAPPLNARPSRRPQSCLLVFFKVIKQYLEWKTKHWTDVMG